MDQQLSGHVLEKSAQEKQQQEERPKRSKLERYIDILKVVSQFGPIRRTHILYKANLAWAELGESLGALQQAEAIRQTVTKGGVFYEITDVGRTILANYTNVQGSLQLKYNSE